MRWPLKDEGCEVTSDGFVTQCSGGSARSMRHVIEPLSYAMDAGLVCDLIMVTNGDNVYALDMWSQVCACTLRKVGV